LPVGNTDFYTTTDGCITVVESSADVGIGSGCLSNNGKKKPRFDVFFPSTWPYVLSVNRVSRPRLLGPLDLVVLVTISQEDFISTYLGHVNLETTVYYTNFTNFEGRGFPDLSAHSLTPNYEIP
jgi:tripeptidyl-peptidase-1